jgi:hypothetical protein
MNVQSMNCCWSNKCSKPSTRYTKGCEQGRHNRSQRKKQHITINTKAQRSSPWGHTTSRNPNFALFALIFFDIFLILYDLSRKHTNFQLNWIEGVAYKNSTILAQNLKYYPGSEFGALEVEFEPLPVGKPTKSLVG